MSNYPIYPPYTNPNDYRLNKTYCDPGLSYTCETRPIFDNCRFPQNALPPPGSMIPRPQTRSIPTWKINYIVSNKRNSTAHFDVDLVNPWGIVIFNNSLWVVNDATDSISNYDLFGNKLLGTISLRDTVHNSSYPTGIAINCSGGFPVTNGAGTKSAQFIIPTQHGTVHAYNPSLDSLHSFIVLNQQLTGEISVYKGLAIAGGVLYLADFFQGHIDVFDRSFSRLDGFLFVDGDTTCPIPNDYSPFNIVNIGQYLYVLWAKKDPNLPIKVYNGDGHGFISVFNLDGTFVCRFASGGHLNSPWAMIPAPPECGIPPGSFLIGNHGNGRINIYTADGVYFGPLLNQSGLPVVIEGLRGLVPHYSTFNEIFFTASAEYNVDGLVGSIVKDQVIYIP